MNSLELLLNSPLIHALGWSLVHFLWQGALVGVVYAALRHGLRRSSPTARYRLAMITLAAMAALPIITFLHLAQTAAGNHVLSDTLPAAAGVPGGIAPSAATPLAPLDYLKAWLQPLIPWAVPLWLAGVMIVGLRVWRGWRHVHALRNTADFAHLPQWNAVVQPLCRLLGIRRLVRLAVSARVNVPCVIGWLKPVILLPPGVITGLTPLQMELVLAHELAHIRRLDYLWNLVQVATETLLFYHPVVRWVSQQARLEREQCCDDMVVALHGNAIDYARALTELESLRHPRAALLLGANGGQVLDRIHRLLGQPATNAAASWLPLLLAAGLLLGGGLMQFIQKTPLLPALTAQHYTLTAQAEQQQAPPARVSLLPTRVAASTAASLPALHAVHASPLAALKPLPGLAAAPLSPAAPRQIKQTSPKHTVPTSPPAGSRVLARVSPTYPPVALERGVEGSATVEFTLTPTAEVTDIRVTRVSGSRLFGQAALDAIRRWKFAPASESQSMSVEFVFQLHGPAATTGPCKIPMGYHVCTN